MTATFPVEIVSAARMVWEGEAIQLTATTVQGEIGIQAGHIPLIATLAPGMAEVVASDGHRQVIAVDGGFVSVSSTGTAIISPYAELAAGYDVEQARRNLQELRKKRQDGDNSTGTTTAYLRALSQVKAADRSKNKP